MNSIIDFYKNVYNHEINHGKSTHLYSARIANRYFLGNEEEITNGQHPYLPIRFEEAEEILKTLELRGNEISFVYFSMGRLSKFLALQQHETAKIYPIFRYDAQIIVKNDEYYVSVEPESKTFLKNNVPGSISDDDRLKKLVVAPHFDFHSASQLADIIAKHEPDADVDELLLFPKLWSNKMIRAALKKPFKVGEKYIPLGVLALIEKEKNSFSTSEELTSISKSHSFSAPLEALFGDKQNTTDEKKGIVCEELNESQLAAIDNSNSSLISVISGPPGTGKSFTIANLAAEKVSKGKSILITSKNKEALDVIEEKISEQLGIPNLCVSPGKDPNFAWMKEYLDFVLGRQYKMKNYPFTDIEKAFENYQTLFDTHLALERKLMLAFKDQKEVATKMEKGLTSATSALFKQRIYESRSKATLPLWESLSNYYQRIDKIREKAISNLQMVNTFMLEKGIKEHRKDLRNYLKFLRANTVERKEKFSEKLNYQSILMAFPVWLIKANDVAKALPLKTEMFDLLIIDEASQCDIPSVLPLMQRAKKVVIVGDTKQLRHISFVSKAFETISKRAVNSAQRHLCRHRNYSVLDLAAEQVDPMQVAQLNEHFRSEFPIIAFSNEQFYKNELSVLTKRPISIAHHVQFIRKSGTYLRGKNQAEIDAITDEINAIIQREGNLPPGLKSSIGILSPFRKQVDALFDAVAANFSINTIKNHRITVGTAFTFQGNERDVMLLSLALDDSAASGSYTYLNRKDVFNVSVTRAKTTQLIYHSFTPGSLNAKSLLARFFNFYKRDLTDDLGRPTKDSFCLEVGDFLKQKGHTVWTDFEVSGVRIDLLTQCDDRFIGIDLIGFPGEMVDYYSLERYKMIERGKIKLFPLPYPLWRGDKEKCMNVILDAVSGKIIVTEIDPEPLKKEPIVETVEKKPIDPLYPINSVVDDPQLHPYFNLRKNGREVCRFTVQITADFWDDSKVIGHVTVKAIKKYYTIEMQNAMWEVMTQWVKDNTEITHFEVVFHTRLDKKLIAGFKTLGFVELSRNNPNYRGLANDELAIFELGVEK